MKGFTLTVLSALAFTGFSVAEELQNCGDARYLPSQYTCYDGNFLCPKINGIATKRCGSACYSDKMYSCANKQLSILPAQSGPFTVQALNPNAPFHGWPIEACGRHFVITQHGPCTYCPENVPRDVCPPGNETLLYAGSGLSVYVPGGQQYYIEPNGALGFTQAHSASYPTGSLWGVSAYQEGAFIYLPSDGWIACPDGNDASSWQVFAKLPGLVFASTCRGFNAVVHGRPSGSFGAWQYT